MTKRYEPLDLRIVRDMGAPLTADRAYHVEETALPHQRVSEGLMTEKDALNLMWDLGSPYPGPRYPDDPWAYGRAIAAQVKVNADPGEPAMTAIAHQLH